VATVPSDEGHRLRAALEVGAFNTPTTRSGLGDLLWLAAVVVNESVGELDATADGQDVVADTMNAEICDRVVAAVAAADEAGSNGSDSAELTGASASDGVGHATAVGEPSGEAGPLVDAEVGFDLLDDGVDESDVGASLVGPAVVDAIRSDEDGRALSESLEAVPDRDAVAVDYIAHRATEPMEAKDEAVRVAGVIVVGDLEGVLTTVDVLDTIGKCGLTAAAAGGLC